MSMWIVLCAIAPSFLGFVLGLMPPNADMRPSFSPPIVRDMSGRDISLDVPPSRIVIYAPVIGPYATIDEGTRHVLACVPFPLAMARRSSLARAYPTLDTLEATGRTFAVDPEQVLLWKPSYVLTASYDAEKLRHTGFAHVIVVDDGFITNDRPLIRNWEFLGKIAGKVEHAHILMEQFDTKMDKLRSIGRDFREKPARVLLLGIDANNAFTMSKSNYLNRILNAAAGISLGPDVVFRGPVNLEQILVFNPDLIVINAPITLSKSSEFYEQPRWQVISAVRDRRVYVMPIHLRDNFAIDDPLLLAWMMEIFHPAKMPHLTRDVYRATYQDAFHYTLSDEEIDQALRIEENNRSYGYDRFLAGDAMTRSIE